MRRCVLTDTKLHKFVFLQKINEMISTRYLLHSPFYATLTTDVLLDYIGENTGVLISPQTDLLPNVFCLMVRIFRLVLVLFYIYK
jgi:hypothetical protein